MLMRVKLPTPVVNVVDIKQFVRQFHEFSEDNSIPWVMGPSLLSKRSHNYLLMWPSKDQKLERWWSASPVVAIREINNQFAPPFLAD